MVAVRPGRVKCYSVRMKKIVALCALVVPLVSHAAPPRAPILGTPEVKGPAQIRWHFRSTDQSAVAFELRDELARSALRRVDDPAATFIDETNVVPADPDMACARYVVAMNAAGERSFGQPITYGCVRTPPVPPPLPKIDILDGRLARIVISNGANDPAVGLGIYEAVRGVWVSPEHLFVADPLYRTVGEWNAGDGVLLIGLRPNASYAFAAQARSVTGERSAFTPTVAVRTPAEAGDPGAPTLDRIGPLGPLRASPLTQTFTMRDRRPVIAGLVATRATVAITLDDRPYPAVVAPSAGPVASFTFVPPFLAPGIHTLRLGAARDGGTAWTPTIEFRVTE